jgi:hypothetical protein
VHTVPYTGTYQVRMEAWRISVITKRIRTNDVTEEIIPQRSVSSEPRRLAFVFLRTMQTGKEPVKVSLRRAARDL